MRNMVLSGRGSRRGLRRVVAALALALTLLGLGAPAASAHPLGNFTVNFSSGIRVEPGAVAVLVVMDAAEIPTVQAFPNAATGVDPAVAASYRTRRCTDISNTADLRLNGTKLPLSVTSSQITFPVGAAGLHTTRLSCNLRTSAKLKPVGSAVTYQLPFETERLGWREITAVGDGVQLKNSTVPTSSPSKVLTAYPKDLLSSPLHITDATMQIATGTGVVAGTNTPGAPSDRLSRGVDKLTAAYTSLIASHQLTLSFGMLAVMLATVLGAMHAFAPGHGKALMAATLVGREGSLRQAVTIGLSVTITHSLGVLLLGLALTFTSLVAPERVYPWLGLISGVLLVTIGATLLRGAFGHRHAAANTATPEHEHTHTAHAHGSHDHAHSHPDSSHDHATSGHDHAHSSSGHDHAHSSTGHDHAPSGHDHAHSHAPGVPHSHAPTRHSHGLFSHTHEPAQLSTRSLLAVGFTGGLVPSPSALLVLLGGIALGRAWFGMVLVIAYGLGMATSLVAVGLALVKCRNWLDRHSARLTLAGHTKTVAFTTRWLPAATSALVILIGLGVVARAALTI